MLQDSKILYVDDDPDIQDNVKTYLEGEGAHVHLVQNSAVALDLLVQKKIDLILLDILIDNENGLQLLQKIKNKGDFPIIIVSGKNNDIDRIIGLEAGADDYLGKPFLPRELSARINAVLRRTKRSDEATQNDEIPFLKFDQWIPNTDQYQLFNENGESAQLTAGEFQALMMLVQNKNKVVTREELLAQHADGGADIRAIDIQITRIRTKLGDDSRHPKYIKTVRGKGYMFIA